ncbi:Vacuolar ATP synthase subunit C [Tilletia horrida]|uniref:V-type proton ATPase subunit C n=1 Tax=Tilletia horrida TaxID=155126 RepID=A0AAN6GJT7_9BASI|nr:Vacuolar ATP synthase subunit C [Tilletia horrida]KAK0560202.1 Vacuolar ATP synthase subunit C [Tilletia horrida]
MLNELAYWLVSVPLEDGDPHRQYSELSTRLLQDRNSASDFGQLSFPPLKAGTLESLIALSDELPKHDTNFTQVVAKIVDTLRNLLNNDEGALSQHVLVNEKALDEYMLDWAWNTRKYRVDRSLSEIVEAIAREVTSIDNVMKQKLNNYNVAKGQLQQLQRRQAGNLSQRSLADVVHKEDFVDSSSEYMETLLVAVPQNFIKDWQTKYERLTPMVVPRSSRKITQDSEFALFNVTVFKKVKEDFIQKCRENKFQVREFQWDDNVVEKQKDELEQAGTSEKELWTELLRLSRTNFSEAYQALTHLKVIRTFVESVLRFGLPAEYFGFTVKPNPKKAKALVTTLNSHFAHLAAHQGKQKGEISSGGPSDAETPGEYLQLLEDDVYPFVVVEQYRPPL